MTDLISTAISILEKRKAALETAISALAGIDGEAASATAVIEKPASTRKGAKRSAATRRKMRKAALARYARVKAEANRVPF